MVYFGTGFYQQFHRAEVTRSGRKHQSCIPSLGDPACVVRITFLSLVGFHELRPDLRTRKDIRSVLQKHLDDPRVILPRRPHERGLTTRGTRIRVGTRSEQPPDQIRASRASSRHDERLT